MRKPTKKRIQSWKATRGELNKGAKLTNAMARAIRRAYKPRVKKGSYKVRSGIRVNSAPYLAEKYDVSVSTIYRIVHKKSYKSSKIGHDTPKELGWEDLLT